jgi:hypothetical protein
MVVRTRRWTADYEFTEHRTARHEPRPAILIVGSCRGDAFVPAEVLVCADTLGAEEAIRTWLAAHDISVMSSNGVRTGRNDGSKQGARP